MKSKKLLTPFIMPLILILFASVIVWKWPGLQQQFLDSNKLSALITLLPIIPYLLFAITIILGSRSNNGGLIFISILSIIIYHSLNTQFEYQNTKLLIMLLFPLNVLFLSPFIKKNIFTKTGIVTAILIFIEVIFSILLVNLVNGTPSTFIQDFINEFPNLAQTFSNFRNSLFSVLGDKLILESSLIILISIIFSLLLLFIYFANTRNNLFVGYFSLILTVHISLIIQAQEIASIVYFTIAGLILIISFIETSFSMAYIDDLTNLPGRRSLNETLNNLGKNFAIAMIDIDHFKKFNDKYGHKTGDEVLKMIASKLANISGGAKTFRFGGEEFTAVFPNRTANEAKPYLEEYRHIVESTPFIIRGKDRKKKSSSQRGKSKKNAQKQVSVTVSIGIASNTKKITKPEKVLKISDKILYKAKRSGRNKVMVHKGW